MRNFLASATVACLLLVLYLVLFVHNRKFKTPQEGYMTYQYLKMHRSMQLKLLRQHPIVVISLILLPTLLVFVALRLL